MKRRHPLSLFLLPALLAGSLLPATPAMASGTYPGAITNVQVTPAGWNRIRVGFQLNGDAKEVAVIAGSNWQLSTNYFHSKWYPASTRSITLTVPASQQPYIGSGTANPIYVRVAATNADGANSQTPISRSHSVDNAYRLSDELSYGYPSNPTPSGPRLRIGEINVNSVTSSQNNYQWMKRDSRVAAEIHYANPDIVTTAELINYPGNGISGITQEDDLAQLLAQGRYGAYAEADHSPHFTIKHYTLGTHIFYKPAEVTPIAQGFINPQTDLHVTWNTDSPVRYLSWVKFHRHWDGKVFYVVAIHFPVEAGDLRQREGKALASYMDRLAGNTPIIISGDFNSSLMRFPNGPQTQLVKDGYKDTAATVHRSGSFYNTCNDANQIDNTAVEGYPNTAYKHKQVSTRIDYIFTKHLAGSYDYVNQLVLTSGGKFVKAYQGTDHNLQFTDIGV